MPSWTPLLTLAQLLLQEGQASALVDRAALEQRRVHSVEPVTVLPVLGRAPGPGQGGDHAGVALLRGQPADVALPDLEQALELADRGELTGFLGLDGGAQLDQQRARARAQVSAGDVLGCELVSARAKSLRVGAAHGGLDYGNLAGAATLLLGGARRAARLGRHRLGGLPARHWPGCVGSLLRSGSDDFGESSF